MARVGRMDINAGEGGETVFVRRGIKPTIQSHVYMGVLALLAVSGGSALVLDDPALVTTGSMLVAIFALVFGLVVSTNAVTYGGRMKLLRDLLVVRPERGEGTGYREAPRPPELVLDGVSHALETLREIVIGHIVIHGRHGTQHMYPVYAVLDECVIEVINHNVLAPSAEVARQLGDVTGAPVSQRETGQMLGGGSIALMVVFLLVQLGAIFATLFPLFGRPSFIAQLGMPAVTALVVLVLNFGFQWLAANTFRRSADRKVAERFGVG